jgi:indolepyruvate decarboxylase
VGTGYFAQVELGDFINGLARALKGYRAPVSPNPAPVPTRPKPSSSESLTFDNFFDRMNRFVDDSMVVVADIGFSVLGAMNIPIKVRSGFVAQAVWSSIGYAAPASMGVKYAMPDKRPVVLAGDGAFHMVCQTIGTMVALKQNPIIFVMNNGIYGVEQWLVNASVFKSPGHPKQVLATNKLVRWEFSQLTEVFGGGDGYKVRTLRELDEALKKIQRRSGQLALVDVRLPELSFPANASWKIDADASASKAAAPEMKRKARKNND